MDFQYAQLFSCDNSADNFQALYMLKMNYYMLFHGQHKCDKAVEILLQIIGLKIILNYLQSLFLKMKLSP